MSIINCINKNSTSMAIITTIVVLLCGCASTKYVPTQSITIDCPPPPRCPSLYIVRQESIVHDLLARKEQYLICRAGVESYYQCLNDRSK